MAFSDVSHSSCSTTLVPGLYAAMASLAETTLGRPTSSLWCSICLCRLDTSTTSKSAMPMVPTPAKDRYTAEGEPRPPAPIISTLACRSLRCPALPTWGMMMWRLYLFTWSAVRALTSVACAMPLLLSGWKNGPVTKNGPRPAMTHFVGAGSGYLLLPTRPLFGGTGAIHPFSGPDDLLAAPPSTAPACLSRLRKNFFRIFFPPPYLSRKEKDFISEGHPQTPGKGAPPLCTPRSSVAC